MELSGQYYSASDNELINLATVTKLWHEDVGLFSTKDKLYYTSCGEDYSVDKSPDQIKELFNNLSVDSAYIQIGEKLLNTKSIQMANYDGKRLYYQLAGDEFSLKLDKNEAEEILAKLEDQKRFQRIKDHVVNMNKVVNIWFAKGGWLSNDRLKLNFIGQSDLSIDMSSTEAASAQNDACARPQFKKIGGETVNIALAGNVWEKDGTLHIKYPGTSCQIDLGSSASMALEHFNHNSGYVSVTSEKVNPKITSKLWYTEKGLLSSPRFRFKVLDDELSVVADPSRSKAVMSALDKDEDYVRIGKKLININSVGKASYDGKRLEYTQGASSYTVKMAADTASKALERIIKHEKFLDIEGTAINAQFASHFNYESGKLRCKLGREEESFKVPADKAASILGMVKELGLKKEAQLNKIRKGLASSEEEGVAWDPDLLAEIYEEIDTMHTTNTVIMVAVVMPMVMNSTSPGVR
jgi:hypothetical protein